MAVRWVKETLKPLEERKLKMDFRKAINHSILIEPSANNGFFVIVGCARLTYTDKKELIADLEAYLDAPGETEKVYNHVFASPEPEIDPGPTQTPPLPCLASVGVGGEGGAY